MNWISRLLIYVIMKIRQYYYSSMAFSYLLWRWMRTGGSSLSIKQRILPRKIVDNYIHNFITLPSGIKLHYVEAGDEDAPLMIMIHGYPEFWYTWRYQINHFKQRYRVIAIDQRGYGDSSKPQNIADYHINILAKDVDDLIHALGYESSIVMGHDWGGAVAWKHSLAYPQSVQSLIILNAPHPAAFSHLLRNNKQQLSHSWYMLLFQTPTIPELAIISDDFKMFHSMFWGKKAGLIHKDNFTEEDMEYWKYTFSQPNALTGPLNYYRCSMQMTVGGKIHEKCIPRTLIIWGEEDAFLIKECATLSAQWCHDAHIHFIKDASHWVQQDTPQQVNTIIDQFLSESNHTKSHI